MPQEFDIACPSCNAVFSVPCELAGEVAECAECDAVFRIPDPPAAPVAASPGLQLPPSDTGAILGVAAADNFNGEVTHTVKLSRTSIGMIPTLKDSFKFDAPGVAAPAKSMMPQPPGVRKPALQRPPSAAAPGMPPPAATMPSPAARPIAIPVAVAPAPVTAGPPTAAASPTATQSRSGKFIDVPNWTGIKLRRDEEALAFHEEESTDMGQAFLVAVPVLLAGLSGMVCKGMIGVVIVGIILLATLGTAIFMTRRKGHQCLLLTTARAVAIVGGKRIEVKK